MARIDASKLTEIIDTEHIKTIMASIGAEIKSEDDEKIVFSSICHNSNSFKLWYYIESKHFFCHRCAESYTIYNLVMKRKNLTFPQALQYICDLLNIPYEKTQRLTPKVQIDNWQQDLGKYLKNKSTFNVLQVYDDSILNFFDKTYHMDWINEGISIETMQLYGIGWYSFRNMITLPVYDIENQLVGIRGRNMNPADVERGMKYIPVTLLDGTTYKFPTNMVLYGLNFNVEAIRRHKRIIIVESEKAVLKLATWYGLDNISVALLGSNLGKYRRDMILQLQIEEVVIVSDKDYLEIGDEEHEKWVKKQQKLVDEFKAYCKVSLVWDNLDEDLLDYKQNATDYDKETFEKLYNNREVIE